MQFSGNIIERGEAVQSFIAAFSNVDQFTIVYVCGIAALAIVSHFIAKRF